MAGELHDDNIFAHIEEGMDVYDRGNHKIGTVERVFHGSMGSAAPTSSIEEATGPITGDDYEHPMSDTFMENFAEAFTGGDELPETLRGRLLREGFIHVNGAGLFADDLYVLPDQVAVISDDKVVLRTDRDELIHS